MIAILSPAKTIDMDKAVSTDLYTKPVFIKEARILMEELLKYSPPEMESLMKVNSKLAEYNFLKHLQWKDEHDLSNGKQAILAYDGAVYQGLNAGDFNEHQLSFANEHIKILSALYGGIRADNRFRIICNVFFVKIAFLFSGQFLDYLIRFLLKTDAVGKDEQFLDFACLGKRYAVPIDDVSLPVVHGNRNSLLRKSFISIFLSIDDLYLKQSEYQSRQYCCKYVTQSPKPFALRCRFLHCMHSCLLK
jgi:hypothetical protein